LRSRPCNADEKWFPTRKNDWILLSDSRLAQVISQSVERVELVLKGGARRSFVTSDLLTENITNLSHGFRIHISFGLDYALQNEITSTILEHLHSHLRKHLESRFEQQLWKLQVEFQAAGESSLDLSIILDCDGSLATHYEVLRRKLQALCVDCASAHGWDIPFPQMTLSRRR
jgi:hypothetical protein